jgi:hypothetical protein
MVTKKKANLIAAIKQLLANKTEISIHNIAQVTGLSKSDESDRKAIRRVLSFLVNSGFLEIKGSARARIYLPTSQVSITNSPPLEASEVPAVVIWD